MRDPAVQSVAVGFFDGVHLGHQAILRGATRALTFANHPLSVLAPEKAPRLMTSLDARIAAIRACGARDVVALEFTPELAATSPEDFAARHLVDADGRPMRIRCGANWNFGSGGAGDAEWLRARGFDVTVVPYAVYGGERVSSSRIRAALAAGEIADANAMLGRPLRVFGEPFPGKGVGRSLGFPTVNLRLLPPAPTVPLGVYEVRVGGIRGIANYGVAPTMGERQWHEPVLEIHFPGLDAAPAADAPVAVDFIRFIRPERRFASAEELREQIARDCR